MRCRNAKEWLGAQRDGDLELPFASALQEHLKQCDACRTFAQRQQHMDTVLRTPMAPVRASLSTEQIMQAVQQQRRITQQLEELHQQQCSRMERMRTVGAAGAALGLFTLSSIPLLLLAMTIIQTDLALKTLALLSGVVDFAVILAQYLQEGLTVMTRNNLLLSGVAFVVVVMMGMWLRLMRPPQQA